MNLSFRRWEKKYSVVAKTKKGKACHGSVRSHWPNRGNVYSRKQNSFSHEYHNDLWSLVKFRTTDSHSLVLISATSLYMSQWSSFHLILNVRAYFFYCSPPMQVTNMEMANFPSRSPLVESAVGKLQALENLNPGNVDTASVCVCVYGFLWRLYLRWFCAPGLSTHHCQCQCV